MILVLPALAAFALARPEPHPNGGQVLPPSHAARKIDFVEKINRALRLRPDQVDKVDDLVRSHQEKIRDILADSTLSHREKSAEVRDKIQAMILEIAPLLTRSQVQDLNDLFYDSLHPGPHARIAVDFSDYLPLSSQTRSIFGRSLTAFGVGFGGDEKVGSRSRFGFGFDLFDMPSYSNKLFVISPQVNYEFRVPIQRRFYAFVGASGGPSYMDYSYNLPDGEHFAAKNLGLDGLAEIGVQWGPLRVGVDYRAFTQPSGLDFDGIEFTAALTVLRF